MTERLPIRSEKSLLTKNDQDEFAGFDAVAITAGALLTPGAIYIFAHELWRTNRDNELHFFMGKLHDNANIKEVKINMGDGGLRRIATGLLAKGDPDQNVDDFVTETLFISHKAEKMLGMYAPLPLYKRDEIENRAKVIMQAAKEKRGSMLS